MGLKENAIRVGAGVAILDFLENGAGEAYSPENKEFLEDAALTESQVKKTRKVMLEIIEKLKRGGAPSFMETIKEQASKNEGETVGEVMFLALKHRMWSDDELRTNDTQWILNHDTDLMNFLCIDQLYLNLFVGFVCRDLRLHGFQPTIL